MLKSKQGKSIETWHVGLCPHATQKDIRHTSRHDWVSTYVPKMVNILPQSQHGTKIPNQRGFPCSYIEQNLQLALRLLLVSYLRLSLIHPPENSISLSDPSIPFPSSSTPLNTRKQLNSAKTIFATSMFRTWFYISTHPTPPKQKKRSPFVSGKLCLQERHATGRRSEIWGSQSSPAPWASDYDTTRLNPKPLKSQGLVGRPGRTVVIRRTETKNTKVMQIS